MNYLQKVQVILEEMAYKKTFMELGGRLGKQGIRLLVLGTEDVWAKQIAAQGTEAGQLVVTDHALSAEKISAAGGNVLAFLHESNREQDFSKLKYAMENPEELEAEYLERVYRRLVRLPWDILETERCFIRETTEDDVEDFYKIYSDSAITQYTEGLYPEIEQEKQYVREYIDKIYGFYDFGVWTVTEKATGQVIGRAGFSYREGFADPEIGFVIGMPWQHRGIAFEICKAILAYGKEQLEFQLVNALVNSENAASLRLCRRLGFEEKEEVTVDGRTYRRLQIALK